MNSQFKKLHLGCGKKILPGFCHIDVLEYDHIDYQSDVRDLAFIPENSAELIYCSHVLEHFGRWEVPAILAEWFRITAPGGILRLAVPDFAACAAIYYEQGLATGLTGLVGLICGGQRDEHDYHNEQALIKRRNLHI
jgi:predicted SAM-dependent methyltransferase